MACWKARLILAAECRLKHARLLKQPQSTEHWIKIGAALRAYTKPIKTQGQLGTFIRKEKIGERKANVLHDILAGKKDILEARPSDAKIAAAARKAAGRRQPASRR